MVIQLKLYLIQCFIFWYGLKNYCKIIQSESEPESEKVYLAGFLAAPRLDTGFLTMGDSLPAKLYYYTV